MLNTEHLSSNKLIKHVDNIKSLVIENELLKYIIKSLKKRLESDKKIEVETQQSLQKKLYNHNQEYLQKKTQYNNEKYNRQQKPFDFVSNPYKYNIKMNNKPKLLIILRKKKFI
jgi:hypothetical protein